MFRNMNVLFCGENPQLILMKDEVITGALSYWRCTYSPYGEGHAVLLMLNDENTKQAKHVPYMIYTNNVLMARYVTDAFNRHFDGWQSEEWLAVTPTCARFNIESDSRHYQRLTVFSEKFHVVAEWRDVVSHELRTFRDMNTGSMGVKGDEHFDVSTVICLCAGGRIVMNGIPLAGEITTLERDGRFSSSAFLAYSEVWTKTQLEK